MSAAGRRRVQEEKRKLAAEAEDARLTELAIARATAWAKAPPGTPYGAVDVRAS
jgi:hypothetical protein